MDVEESLWIQRFMVALRAQHADFAREDMHELARRWYRSAFNLDPRFAARLYFDMVPLQHDEASPGSQQPG